MVLDLALASELYGALLAPLDPLAKDKRSLLIAPSGALTLNADWVVLSACNTIAGDKPGAEALSGVARSVLLCRRAGTAGDALVGGFRRRHTPHHIDLRTDESRPQARPRRGAASGDAGLSQRHRVAAQWRYPGFWGPFALIGEGAAR
jgi:CHAT domain-containing protein